MIRLEFSKALRVFVVLLGGLLSLRHLSNQDLLKRERFALDSGGDSGTVAVIALSPKLPAHYPVVVLIDDFGLNTVEKYRNLRRVAELGVTAVAVDWNLTNQKTFNQQFASLQSRMDSLGWGRSNRTGWISYGRGADLLGEFLSEHPGRASSVAVYLSPTFKSDARAAQLATTCFTNSLSHILFVHGGRQNEIDGKKPLWLEAVEANYRESVKTIRNLDYGLGEERGLAFQVAAEFCCRHFLLTDYTSELEGSNLSAPEKSRWNRAISRLSLQRRQEILGATLRLTTNERRSAVSLVGQLNDFDLARISGAALKESIQNAWRTRRRSTWCSEVPIDLFNTYTIFPHNEENYKDLQVAAKYCGTARESRLAVEAYLKEHWLVQAANSAAVQITCEDYVALFARLSRLVGLPTRKVLSSDGNEASHWLEIWSSEAKKWEAFKCRGEVHACELVQQPLPFHHNPNVDWYSQGEHNSN